jgi:plasmid stabilization system protein ParE
VAFHVVVLPRAQADIANAVEWLAERSPDAANRWRLGLLSKIEKLESDPWSFSLADESIDLDVEIRQLLFGF